ncbi:MAG: undecaprenyldiphospho-muramoylpentapeptide beta-N-acetylglucosaminyltransferase [Candidatus Omnitrophica bacterium]|nr:undecaprenyldiphospho-muramoylpentapeptide beta-N-acetylglucosaminyltransferase [Candidatus Omnitrophota bacterium]
MENESPLSVLLIADGSGGHLIPALEAATALAKRGVRATVWYAQRRQTAPLARALIQEARRASVDVDPLPVESTAVPWRRLAQCGRLWRLAQRGFDAFAPDVVVGFGGWVSIPVILAARMRRIGCVLHEQNVVPGRANRWLTRWADRIAVSFPETQRALDGAPAVVTGLPVRSRIGRIPRTEGAARFGLDPARPTVLVLGGSQGARTLNQLLMAVAAQLAPEERRTWQVIHLTGPWDEEAVADAYATRGVAAWVAPSLMEMETAYAQADLVIARAGASTVAELARCGKPAILIPYPFAGGHQRANARLVEAVGGGVVLEESGATPAQVLSAMRSILADGRLRSMMGAQVRGLQCADATERLTETILDVGRGTGGHA